MAERAENIPPFLQKGSRKKRGSKDTGDTSPVVGDAALFLENLLLKEEVKKLEEEASRSQRRADLWQQTAGGAKVTLEGYSDTTRLLRAGNKALAAELLDAYAQLGEVPRLLDQAWNRGYDARGRVEALTRIEARRRERENGIGRRAVNFIRDRVTLLTTTVPQIVSSLGNRLRNII